MNSTRMLWHLTKFDGLRMRWWWLAYLLTLTLSMFLATGVLAIGGQDIPHVTTAMILQLLVLVFAVELAQVDGPYNRLSFLKAKPVSTVTFGLSKLLPLATLVVLAALAAAISILSTGVPIADALELLPRALLFFALTILLGLFAGVSTRTVPSALLMLLGIPTLILTVGALLSPLMPRSWQWNPPTGPAAASWVLLVGILLLVAVYARVPRVIYTRVVTVALGVVGFTTTCGYVAKPAEMVAAEPLPISERMRFDTTPTSPLGEPLLRFSIEGARGDRRYELRNTTLTLHGVRNANGTDVRDAVTRPSHASTLGVTTSAFDVHTGIGWRAPSYGFRFPAASGTLSENLGNDGTLTRVDSVSVATWLVRLRAERLVERRLTPGVLWAADGEELAVEERAGQPQLVWRTVRRTDTREDRDALFRGNRPIDRHYAFVVIDSARRSAELVETGSSSGGSIPLTLLLLESHVTRMPLPRATSIIVYRWVEDGRQEITSKWAVPSWPVKSLDRLTLGVLQR